MKILKETKDNPIISKGNPYLFGTKFINNGINFNLVSFNAKNIFLYIFYKGEYEPTFEIEFPIEYKFGNNWTMFVSGIDWSKYDYAFKVKGDYNEEKGLYFDDNFYLIDPYANKVNGLDTWGQKADFLKSEIVNHTIDLVDKPNISTNELIIYEAHLRGFTKSANVDFKGTYKGLIEKIPYLKELGVNCIELLPIFEFNENENPRVNPKTGEKLKNYWGYSTISYFAPKTSYSNGNPILEFKELVNELHKNNIKIVLDVVYNHTCELGRNGWTISFKGLDTPTYYMIDDSGDFINLTGCGNTFNCNNAPVKEFILNSLRYWAIEYNVDGFRFDLASVLLKDEKGNKLSKSLIDDISNDSILSNLILIAEPWDCSSYNLGQDFNKKWYEWNDKYRDSLRSFLTGKTSSVYNLKTAIDSSYDLNSINFITAHDGFTLMDLFSYEEKHNEDNGENNFDGNNNNISINCGEEGIIENNKILDLRLQLIKNAFIILLLSKGIPMINMGDEVGRSQKGNNNAYCQDNEISWFDWTLVEKNKDLFDFVKSLIDFRKNNIDLLNSEITFHGVELDKPDYGENSHTLAFSFKNENAILYVVLNMYKNDLSFEIPYNDMNIIFNNATNFIFGKKLYVSSYSSCVLYKNLKS